MPDPFAAWLGKFLASQGAKRAGALLAGIRDKGLLASAAHAALRDAVLAQHPEDEPAPEATATSLALRELWSAPGSLPIGESPGGPLIERLLVGVEETFSVLARTPSPDGHGSQAAAFDLEFRRLAEDFVIFLMRRLETSNSQSLRELRKVLAEGLNELRHERLRESINALHMEQMRALDLQARALDRLSTLLTSGRVRSPDDCHRPELVPTSSTASGTSRPTAWNIPRLSQRMIGRTAACSALASSLTPGKPTVLTGTAGLGKSMLAASFAWQFRREREATIGWWIRAEDDQTLLQDYSALAQALNLPDPENLHKAARLAMSYLEDTDALFILVFDNARDARQIQAYIPGGQGVCVATSRTATGWLGRASVLRLDELDSGSAVGLLLELSGLADRAQAGEVVDVLGGNPLALENAARLTERMGWSFREYKARLEDAPEWALEQALDPTDQSIMRAMSTSIEQLSPHAKRLLSILAWLDPDSIPRPSIEGAKAENELDTDRVTLSEATGELLRVSLVKAVPERNSLWIHRVVQVVGRTLADRTVSIGSATRLILARWPADPEIPSQRALADELAAHVARVTGHGFKHDGASPHHADATLRLVQYYRVSGATRQAFDLAERLAQVLEGDSSLLPQLARLSLLRGRLRRYSAENVRDRWSWGVQRFQEGIDHARAGRVRDVEAEALMQLAYLQIQGGEAGEGLPSADQALAIGRELQDDCPRVLPTLLGLQVENLVRVGSYESAYRHASEMRSLVLELFPAAHPFRSYAENQLALASTRTSRYVQALEGYQRAVAESEQALGGRLTDALAIRYANLAWALLNLDRPEEGLEWALRAMEVSKKVGTPPNAFGLRYGYVAYALSLLGDPSADGAYEEVEEMARASGGAALATRLRMIARHLTRTGRPAEALAKLREAQSLIDSGTNMRIEYVDEIRRDLGEAEVLAGDKELGKRLLREALKILEGRAGPSHRATALARLKLAWAIQAEEPAEAVTLACRASQDLEGALGRTHRETREAVSLCRAFRQQLAGPDRSHEGDTGHNMGAS